MAKDGLPQKKNLIAPWLKGDLAKAGSPFSFYIFKTKYDIIMTGAGRG
jgi:hypothetical protein